MAGLWLRIHRTGPQGTPGSERSLHRAQKRERTGLTQVKSLENSSYSSEISIISIKRSVAHNKDPLDSGSANTCMHTAG